MVKHPSYSDSIYLYDKEDVFIAGWWWAFWLGRAASKEDTYIQEQILETLVKLISTGVKKRKKRY